MELRKRKKCVLSCDLIRTLRKDMFEQIDWTKRNWRENGFIAYQDPFSCKLKIMEKCKGEECGMVMKSAMWGNLSFHTHPRHEHGGLVLPSDIFPSVSDILVETRENRIFCIGGIQKDGSPLVRCWKPPAWRSRFTNQMFRDANRTYLLGQDTYPKAVMLQKLAQNFSDRSEDEKEIPPFCRMEGWRR